MLGGIAAAVAIIFFVTAHEAGHFLAAKATGMKATEFFFGFGPRLWSTRRGETEYGIKALPLGGYVRIIGMNPLEDVAPEDMGRTYREKKFWEKSVVVLAGVGTNFLIAFLMFWGVFVSNGVTEVVPSVEQVVAEAYVVDGVVVAEGTEGASEVASPAALAGLERDDEIVAIGRHEVGDWADMTAALEAEGPGAATLTILRDGVEMTIDVNLLENTTPQGGAIGYLGVRPAIATIPVGPIEGVGMAGQAVWGGIGDTFSALYQMFRPSSLAQYLGVLGGDTDVPNEIRPVSPIGIVSIGSQAESTAGFVAILAYVNVILATINLLPLFPLDGGHFAVALYEKVSGREANIRRLMPVAAAVIGALFFLGFVAIVLDIVNPISLG